MKRILAVILAALSLFSLAACAGGGTPAATSSAPSTTSAATSAASSAPAQSAAASEPPATEEIVELNLITTLAQEDEKFYETPVYQEFTRLSGVKLTTTHVDKTKLDLLLAGGDTTDLIACSYADYYKTLASGGLVLRLNDLIDQYGTSLKDPIKDVMWTLLKANYDNGDGSIYGVTNSIGMQGGNARATNHGFYINWEYFKEIGAPEMTSYDDFINALEEIMKLHPTTEDGLPIYALSFYNAPNDLFSFYGPMLCYGFRTFNPYISTRYQDNSLSYAFLDEDGPYWMAAKYMNTAYSKGLVDPDSFTQTNTDFNTKFDNGQLLTSYYASSAPGFEIVPISGTIMQENLFDIGANSICIASTCKDEVAAIKLLDFLHSPEAGRLIYSGVEGIHWDYDASGVPVFNQETLDARSAGGDVWAATGVDNYILYSIVGVARGVEVSDGSITALTRMKDFFTAGLNENGKDYSAFYSERDGKTYEYPNQVLYARGVTDGLNLNSALTKSYGTAPDDIARIDAALLELAINAVPKLVMAAPGDYEKVKAEVLKDFEDAGVQTSYAYWQGRWDELAVQFLGK